MWKVKHTVGVDARVDRTRVEESLPLSSVAGHVHLQQRLAEARLLTAPDVDPNSSAVDSNGEVLTRKMAGTDVGPAPNVAESHRVR
jgi:hypothetical protein